MQKFFILCTPEVNAIKLFYEKILLKITRKNHFGAINKKKWEKIILLKNLVTTKILYSVQCYKNEFFSKIKKITFLPKSRNLNAIKHEFFSKQRKSRFTKKYF
jgi:hypothetical protein